jgi:hypothetical protein
MLKLWYERTFGVKLTFKSESQSSSGVLNPDITSKQANTSFLLFSISSVRSYHNFNMFTQVKEEVDKMLKAGIVESSDSPYAAPVVCPEERQHDPFLRRFQSTK